MKKLLSLIATFLILGVAQNVNAGVPEWGTTDSEFETYVGVYADNLLEPEKSHFLAAIGDQIGDAAGELALPQPSSLENVTVVAKFEIDYFKSNQVSTFTFAQMNTQVQLFIESLGRYIDETANGLNEGFKGWYAEEIVQESSTLQDDIRSSRQILIGKLNEGAEELPGVPLDGGLSLLAIAGIAFGAKRFRN